MLPDPPNTARHLEVERKFDVDGFTPAPSFTGLNCVTRVQRLPAQSLDAVYFDTPTRDLDGRRITLRRRTGSTDAGWQLKLPAGPEARTEIRLPLGTGPDNVPAELLDVVAAVVRDRPIAPVARISTTRDVMALHGVDGIVFAEFCDDRVSAVVTGTTGSTTQHWREWELELRDHIVVTDPGGVRQLLNRLGSRLLDAGATPARHRSKLARALRTDKSNDARSDPMHRAVAAQVDQLLVWDRAVRADADDSVHQLRVSIRQIRSLLQSAPDTFNLHDDRALPDELRWLASLLGVARDAEVLGMRHRRALDRLSAELIRGPVVDRLVRGAADRYQAGRRAALDAMRSPRYFRLLDRLDGLLDEPARAESTAVPTAPAGVAAAYRRVRKAVKVARTAAPADRDAALHRIRKGVKRLRYTAAAVDAPRVAERAAAVQTLLGDHQDSVVSRAHLLARADAAHAAGEDNFTYGLLYQQESDLADRCRAQLEHALAQLAKATAKATKATKAAKSAEPR